MFSRSSRAILSSSSSFSSSASPSVSIPTCTPTLNNLRNYTTSQSQSQCQRKQQYKHPQQIYTQSSPFRFQLAPVSSSSFSFQSRRNLHYSAPVFSTSHNVAGAAIHVTDPSPLTPQEYHDVSEFYLETLQSELERMQEDEGSPIEVEYSVCYY